MVFGDPAIGFSGVLLEAVLSEVRRRDDVEVVAVCNTSRGKQPPEPVRDMFRELRWAARRLFSPVPLEPEHRTDLLDVARRFGVPVIAPPGSNINHAGFLECLRSRWCPSLALSVGCLQIFGPRLLDSFDMAVNYHDGLLPGYKGLAATSWSLYHREPVTGYTFHRMEPGIDTGAILVQGAIEVNQYTSAAGVRSAKSRRAARDAARVLDLMSARVEGQPQEAGGSYFSRRDRGRISRIDDPSQCDAKEILHRLHCFEVLEIRIDGCLCEVTALRATTRPGPLAFRTRDGRLMAVQRAMFLPPTLYGIYRRLRRR